MKIHSTLINRFDYHFYHYLKLFTGSALYQRVKFYITDYKPHVSLSLLMHLLVMVLAVVNFIPLEIKSFINKDEKVIVLDLVQVSNTTNINIATDIGKKSYAKNVEVAKPKQNNNEQKKDTGGEKIPIQENVKNTKRKPPESEAVTKEKGEVSKLDSAFKSIKQEDNQVKINIDNHKEEGGTGKGKQVFNKLKPKTLNIAEAVRSQFIYCWSVPYGALNADNMKVTLNISLDEFGKILEVDIADMKRYNHDPFFRAMADSASRAVYKCSPLQGLPPESYHMWKNMELTFDPRDMFK